MAKNNNVETHKKNTKIENKKSSELKPKETTKKKKLRLHSHLRVNIPLFQSLMMILPSLAKHAEANEGSGDSTHDMDLAATTPVADETIVDKHAGASSFEATHPNTQTNESQESPNTNESQVPHGANTHLVPSHHLSTLSHPQVHYIPSVSMPTISAGGNGQPSHSNTPPTPTTPVTFIPEVIKGTYGELHVDVNGQYTFVLNPNSPQYILLNQHQQGTDHFALHLSNGASIVVQIPVTGKQDLPSISGDLTGVVTEDHNIDSQGLLHANGKIDVIDPDQDESSVTPEVISGKYGSLTIDADGHWQYQVDNSLSNVQALTGATSLHESFTIHTKDGTPQTIDMTIGGNDDNAVITGVDAGSVIEDLTTQVQGQLSVTDPDLGEDHFQASQVNGHFGTLTITKDGAWTYDLDNYNPYVQRLAQGSTATDIITVHSADGTAHQVTITINGTNDSAVITNNTGGSPNSFFVVGKSPHLDQVIEDHKLTVSGKLSISDIDAKEGHFSNTDVAGTLGTLHLKDNGAWTYDLDNTNPAVQALGKGSATTDIMTIHSADGTPHQITIIINGTNDKAVIGGTSSGAVTEETQLQTSGALTITDVDTGEAHFSNTDVVGTLGTLHLKDNGAWTYDLDNTNPKVQALGKGATATDTITVHSADGTQHQVAVTINGTNDRPTISGTSSGAVIEQGLSTAGNPDATGSLIATDIDKSDTITWAINQPQGQWGTLSIDQHGHWHYQLDNSTGGAADKLAAGEHQSESFWITATDSTGATVPHKIVIDVQGSNDKPIVSAWTQLPAGKEDQPVTIKASDLLTHASDVDSSDVLHVTNLQATHGSLIDNKDGTYTFTPDKDFNGEIRLTYDVVDGHGGSVSTQARFDLTAAPDNAIITDAQTNADLRGVTEDRGYIDTHYQLHYDGKLNIQDPDKGEAQFDPNIGSQTYQGIGYDTKLGGHILLMRDGHYTYTLDNRNIQNLAQGEVKHDSAVIRSADGTTHTIELTVHGTNDAPTINAQSHSVTEGGSVLNGQMVGQDIDTGAALTYSAPQIDGLVVNPDGSYSFNPAHSSYQSLASGVTKTLTVPVTVTDEHNASSTQNLSITITGVNNSAVIGGVDTGDVTEGNAGQDMSPDYAQPGMAHLVRSTIRASGKLSISDTDTGEAEFDTHGLGFNYSGQYGDLLLRKDGTWFYHADTGQIRSTGGLTSTRGTAIDQLGENQTLTDTITVYSKDGTSHDIVITIHGSNDRPYCASEVQLNSGKEDLAQTITATELLANTVDVDANDAGKLTIANLHADHGSIQDNHDGTFTFHPSQDYNGKVSFTYDVQDAHGGSTATSASMTLAPISDAAVITGSGSGVKEDFNVDISSGHLLGASGVFHVVDPDGPAQSQFPDVLYGGTYQGSHGGDLQVNSNGNYYYHISNYLVQHLSEGETLKEEYTIHSVDGTQHKVEFTVEGTNDKPVLSAQSQSVTEGGTLLSGQMHATDVDTKDTHTFTIDKPVDGLTFNNDGSYTFDPSHTSYQNLGANNNQVINVQVKVDDHNGGTDTKTLTLVVHGTNDVATIGGQDTFTVQEDHNLTLNSGNTIIYNGQLTITDADAGEDHFDENLHQNQQTGTWDTGYTTQEGGKLILQSNGSYRYEIDNSLAKIQSLGSSETLIDTVTVRSADGTSHQIQVTIQGDNDAPVVSSAVTLTAGTEDTDVVLHISDLLANATDIDHNDVGKLSVANLIADHGNITDNHDGTFTFHPSQDYNGKVSFTYDVQDAHGGSVSTSASLTLAPTRDSAVISGDNTGTIIEDHNVGHSSLHPVAASGLLRVTDPDAGQDHFQVNRLLGEQAIHDPFGGFLRITPNGAWGYEVANSRLQSLAEGEVEKVVYRVYSADHTAHDITITVTGTNDRPTITATTLAHGTEDINYQMQASQFGFADVDTGDTMHSITITDLPPAAQGKFLLDGHDITAGQTITAADIAKLQFVPTPNFNGDVQFKFTVNDGHVDSQEATNTLHIDAVSDAAQFTGRDAGDVHEGHGYTAPDGSMSVGSVDDRSPDHTRGNIGKLWNDEIHTDGHLNIVDPDSGESHAQTGTYQGTHGHVILQSNGDWSYYASIGQDATGRKIDRLGQGESITDTVTVKSADGTTHDIHITIHGDNDRPYCSSEVQLNSGKEDLAQTITTTELLTNTVDVDTNDAGQLSIANLHADHGTLVDNKDGTFTFTPDHNFNGKVHFTYDIKDAHGGVTHTGASTTLLPSNDAATLQPTLASNFVTEDNLKSGTSTNELWSGWKNLEIQDIDSPSEAKVTQIEVNGVKHTVPANFAMNLAGAHGIFNFTHSTDGHDKWSYSADNSHTEVQSLSHGDSLTDTITLITADGTRIPLTAKILGTDDHVIIDTPDALTAALGTAVEDKVTSISGTLLAHDSDSKDSVTFTAGNSVGSYGILHVDSNGQWHYNLDHSKANALQQGETKAEGFDITATSTDGSTATKHIEVLVQGSNDKATISVTSNPDVHEDSSSTPVEIISGKLSALDPDHDQSAFSTDVGKRHDPFNSGVHGGLHISKDGSWTYTVNNSQIQQLAAGQEEHVQYNVHTVGGDYHVIDIKIVGTNDIPTVSATTLVHGTEDTHYQMQASQFGFTDVDTGDTLRSIAITDLPPAAQGKFVLDGHDITAGQSISASDIAKLQFIPATDFNGDVQFKFTVNDGHASSAEATNTLHIDAVGDAATIAGVDTGGVTEDSFYGMQWLITKGQLTISDADTGEDKFDPMLHAQNNAGIGYDTKLGGHVLLSKDGSWQYNMDNFSPAVQKLAEGETAIDTVTIHSVDGTSHEIQVTITGTNDAPVLSVTQTTPTTGTLIETDVDVKDTHIFSVVSSTGQFGSLSVDPDSGAYIYTANGSVAGMSYNAATHTYHGTDVFEVKVADNHGGESSKFITFDANGHVSVVPGQSPTISTSVPSNPLVTTTQPSLPTGTNTPPNNAVTVDLAATSDTGTSDTDNLTKDSTPTVTGHTDIPYSQVTIYDGSTPIGHAVSDGSGQYSVAVSSLSNGDHNLSAKALAPSSVLPATSSILSLHVDTVVAPLQISLTHDTGSNSSDLITSDGSLTINGQEAGATVEYSTDNGHTWTSSFTPQQGSNTVSVRQTDTAGNVSTETSVSFTLDNTVNAPTVSLSNDTGRHSINTPDLITKDSRLSIQTEAGAKVEYSNDGGHTWTAVFNPVEGVNDLQVRQTDIAGNVSPVTHFSFTLDTTPGTITVNPISQDNALNAAENNQPLVITGTTSNIAPGDVVYVVIGNKHFYDATVKPDGTWSLTLGTSIHQNIMATDRDYSIQVGTVDTAGNSTPRISTHLLVDTQSPIPHIAVDSVTQDNVLNALESGQTIAITGTVTGDYQTGDIVSLKINGATISSLTGSVDSSGHFSIPVAGNILEHANIHTSYANGQSGSIHSIEATIITTDAAGNVGSATTGSQVFSVDNHVSLPTITFENPGPDGLYSKAEIAHGHPNTVTATITPPGDAKVGEHLVVNGQDHVLDAHTLQHGIQIEVHPGSNVQATMTDEHGNTAGSQGFAASAIPEPIIVRPPSGSHQVSGTLGVPPLAPSQTPVPSAQNGWRIHLPNGQYVTSHHGQYGTLTIDPQTGHLHYQEQAQVHTGPHGSASGIGQHEDKFEIALQGTNQDEVVAHVNVQILSHGPGHSGKLTVGTEVVDMTITPIVHASHPAPPPPPPVQHDEPEIASHEDFTFTVSEDTSLDLSQHAHQESDQKTDHHAAAAYLDVLGIQPNASPSTGHDQPADMDIVLAQVDQQHAVDYDQAHLDMSDALEHHDAANNHNQDDEHHHHNDVDGLPDIDPNN
ncbi:VCBS domain-containing protein [Vibrio chagasii]|uniref:VCBS domain-containing protein n=1 Tax=Vibrio chagasii TaxID=170679 RepID=UPI0038CD8296